MQTGDYIFKPGYAIVLPTLEGDTCFVPVVTRRENNWPEQLIPNLKVLLAAKMPAKATRLIPVVICEDMVHVVQVRKEIEKHEHIRNLTVAYAIDVAIGGGSVFDTLLLYSGIRKTGSRYLRQQALNRKRFSFKRRLHLKRGGVFSFLLLLLAFYIWHLI